MRGGLFCAKCVLSLRRDIWRLLAINGFTPSRTGTDHVDTTAHKYKDRVYRTHMLHCSNREDGVVKDELLGRSSCLASSRLST